MVGHIGWLSSNLVSQDSKIKNIKIYAKQIDADIDQIFKELKIPLTGLIRLDSGLLKGKSSFPKLEKVIMKCLDKIFDYVIKKDMGSFQNIYFSGVQQLHELLDSIYLNTKHPKVKGIMIHLKDILSFKDDKDLLNKMVQAYSKLNKLKTVQVKHGSKAFWTTMQTLRFRNKYRENETFNGFFQTNPSTGKQLDLLLAINKVSLMLMIASASITLAKELVRKNVFNPKQNLTNSINLIRDKMPSIQLYGNQIVPFLKMIEKKNLDKALDKLIVRLNYESPDQLIAKLNGFSETQANEWVDEAYCVSGEPLIEDILKNQIFRL